MRRGLARKSFQLITARRKSRVPASASSTWRNQMRQPRPSGISSRRLSDRATSSGDRSCRTGRTDQPASRNTGDQKAMSRHIRGSLMTARLASGNSSARADIARSFSANALAGSMRFGSNSRQSSHWLPQAARISSFKVIRRVDSQYPFGLSWVGGIKLRGAAPPSRISAPATLEVPLRCIPRTRTAVLPVLSAAVASGRPNSMPEAGASASKFTA